MNKFRESEEGMLIIEASIVFPVMFFVLFFLIYMGNMFYMRCQIDSITAQAAIRGASYCADPLLEEIKKQGKVPDKIDDIQPYRYISSMGNQVAGIEKEVAQQINALGAGFFAGMNARNAVVKTEFRNHLFYNTFTVEVSYLLKFPIRFMGEKEPTILKMDSRTIVPVTDTAEFIGNIDMVIDYAETTGFAKKVSGVFDRVKEIFKIGSFKE